MSNVRDDVALILAGVLPDEWDIIPHATDVDHVEPGHPVLMIFRARVKPGPTFGAYTNELQLWLLDEHTTPGEVDDSLDERLAVLLAALHDAPALQWTDAERGVYADQFHGFVITVNVNTKE